MMQYSQKAGDGPVLPFQPGIRHFPQMMFLKVGLLRIWLSKDETLGRELQALNSGLDWIGLDGGSDLFLILKI